MIKADGGLWEGPSYLAEELKKKGWRYVVNPKRNYYPEYDTTHPNYKSEEDLEIESDILKVEVL